MSTSDRDTYTLTWESELSRISREEWNRLALPAQSPFLEWGWLVLMETSGSIVPENGWQPCHLAVRRNGALVAAAPLYIKAHSIGEFVFDYVWADAAARMDIEYYPKLVGMSPVTPLSGYRFLVDPQLNEAAIIDMMFSVIDRFCETNRLSGCHLNFVEPDWRHHAQRNGYTAWCHQSYLWTDKSYGTFSGYLQEFNTNQRKNIRKERRSMARQGIRLDCVPGTAFPAAYSRRMYEYYSRTNDKFGLWGCKYLTPAFFDALPEAFGHRLVFVSAAAGERDAAPIGLSMLVHKNERLYGRYWGSVEDVRHLHFNVCYYAPIQHCIERGIRYYDPGMGGEHKLRRGFVSVPNFSMHRYRDERMRQLMEHHIGRINEMEMEAMAEMNARIPWRQG